MAHICGIRFREIIFLQVLTAVVHLKDCRLEQYSVVTAKSGDDVVFVSDPYSPRDLTINSILLRLFSTGMHQVYASFFVYSNNSVKIEYKVSYVSIEVQLVEPRNRTSIAIQNVTVTLTSSSEADSGVYTMYAIDRPGQPFSCSTLYVLGVRKYGNGHYYIEEETLFNVTDFNHLSEEVAQWLNVSTSWRIEDQFITHQSGYTVNITRSMNNKSLTYTIEGQNHNATSVNYILNVSYTGPIIFEPNQTSYTVSPDSTLKPITCDAICNPTCNIIWQIRNDTVSETDILRPRDVFDRFAELICQATNSQTGKTLSESIFFYIAEQKELTTAEQDVESRTLVYVFATLTVVFVLSTTVLTVHLCRHNLCSLSRPRFIRRAAKTDSLEMVPDNVATSATEGSADRPIETYDDLQSRGGQENMYDCIQNQQAEDRKTTYENLY